MQCDSGLGEATFGQGQGHDPWFMDNGTIQIRISHEKIKVKHKLLLFVHCDIDLCDMTLSQDHNLIH